MKPADAKIREKLKGVRDELATLRADRTRLGKVVEDGRESAADAIDLSNPEFVNDPTFVEFNEANRDYRTCLENIILGEDAEKSLLAMLTGTEPVTGNGSRPAVAPLGSILSPRALLEGSEDYATARSEGIFTSKNKFGTLVLGELCDADGMAAWVGAGASPRFALDYPAAPPADVTVGNTGSAYLVQPDYRGLQPPSFKALTFLDMIPTGTTDSNLIEYVQLKAVPEGAKNVAELELKPQLGIEFEDASSAVRTIAAFMKMSRPSMSDVPGLASMINTLLPREIRRHLEDQCLNGDGTGQNLLGLMNVAGLNTVAGTADDNIADAILRGITTLVLVDESPNFVTLNPITVQDLALSKTTTGEYTFGYPGMYNTPSIWGLAVTQNRTIAEASPLIGDNSAHQLLVREGLLVKTSDNDQDDFVRNRVTVLSETRVAYIVWRPYAFCEVDLTLVPNRSTLSNGGGTRRVGAGGGGELSEGEKDVTTPQRGRRPAPEEK